VESSPVSIGTTTSAHKAIVFGVQGDASDTTMLARAYHFDVGIDTASTSWLSQDEIMAGSTINETVGVLSGMVWLPIYASVPSGSVLVVGAESSGTADALNVALYGVS
jgi:hypothetical protein